MGLYIPPSVRTTRIQGQVTAVNAGQRVQLCLVGESVGRQDYVQAVEVERAASPSEVDTLTETYPLIQVTEVRSDQSGGIVYVEDVDYTVDLSLKQIDWSADAVIPPPYLLSLETETTGGLITAGTYYYVVTAQRTTNLTGPVVGETVISNEASIVTTGATSTVTLTWTPVPGAEAYVIYRSTVSGTYTTPSLIATVVGGYVNTYTDDAAAPSVGAPPGANNAYKRPAHGASYYVDYIRRLQDYFQPNLYTRLGDIISDYGLGSPIAKAATWAMGTSGRGNEAIYCIIMAIPDSNLSTFQTAFDMLLDKDLDLLLPMSTDFNVALSALAHCELASGDRYKKERRLVWGPIKGTVPGDPSTTNSARWHLAQLNDQRFAYVYPWAWSYTQQQDGSVLEEELDGYYLASAVAGLVASQPDRATSTTFKQVQGITRLGKPGGRDLDNALRDLLASEGACIISPDNPEGTIFVVRDSITTSLRSEEERSIEIMMVEDYLRQAMRAALRDLIGLKNLRNRRDRAEKVARKVFAAFQKEELITSFNPASVQATTDPNNPTYVTVYGSYTPIYTIKVIDFRYSFDLSIPTPVV